MVREFHDYLVGTVFPGLTFTEGRIELLGKLEGQSMREAMWIMDSLHRSLGMGGDVCEFGCAAGATSALLANEIRTTDKALWLFDSFKGLPRPSEKDQLLDDFWNLGSMEAYEGTMGYPAEMVKSKLEAIGFPISRVEIVPGFIEQTLQSNHVPEEVCFALGYVDFYQPVLTALSFLRERLSAGGRIVVDDYGAFSSGAKTAVDEFIASHSDSLALELPPDWVGHFGIITRRLS